MYFTFHYLIKDIDTVLHFTSSKLKGGQFKTTSDGDLIKLNGDIHNDLININKIDENCYNYVMFSEKQNTVHVHILIIRDNLKNITPTRII